MDNRRLLIKVVVSVFVAITVISFSWYLLATRHSDNDPWSFTYSQLGQIEKAIILYYDQHDSWPAQVNWQEQLPAYFYDVEKPDEKDLFYVDAWGQTIQYRNTVKGGSEQIVIYSFGPDGNDDDGYNDDLVTEVKLPPPVYESGDQSTSTRKQLQKLLQALHEDRLARGSWASREAWRSAIEPFLWEEYEDTFNRVERLHGKRAMFDGKYSVFRDAWGNEIVYVVDESVTPIRRRLYSFGWNGEDDMGAGDDIAVEVEMPAKLTDPNS